MKSNKAKSVALNAEVKQSRSNAINNFWRKAKIVESDIDDSSPDLDEDNESNPDDQSSNSETMEMVAMIVKGFKRMKYRSPSSQMLTREGTRRRMTWNQRLPRLINPRSNAITVMEWVILQLSVKRLNLAQNQGTHHIK